MKKLLALSIVMLLASAASANLLTNGSFDDAGGSLTGWDTGGWAVDTSTFNSGPAAALATGGAAYPLAQYVAVPGATPGDITMTFNLWSDRVSGGGKITWRLYGDADGVVGSDRKGDTFLAQGLAQDAGSQSFIPVELTFNAASTYNYYGVWFLAETGSTTYRVDDVTLDVAPEPATMSLLGLGGLALLRRRRRN